MNEREVLAAADAVFDAERALRRAADTVDELGDLAASSLRVLDDAATDAFYAHQEERRDFYLESAGDHLVRLRNRSGLMNEFGEDLSRHLAVAGSAIERAGDELARGTDGDDRDADVRALRSQIDVLSEVVALARPVADQITRHAQHAAESAAATEALMLLDSRVHQAGQEVTRADEGVSMMRSVIESAQSRARTSAALAGSLSYAVTHPPAATPGGWDMTGRSWSSGPPQQTHQPGKRADPGIAI
ncbi:phage gpG-like protein [Nocardioides aromaticivorans]|uniref:Phage gpG-like protein n=1 Tax=Nocardioides aromaticivorans TaxID=200618 RepID=A0A7Z0CNL3_9ACTN|nr:hypothetical protein [Nocardioides aromaticivorans]NYI47941.1 phage gpG-like protein [Nocardioides aromaticivorans]